jgi:energy-coupling factor transporter transmembrane protein EcfT
MMNIVYLIILVLFIAAAIVIFKITKTVFKAIMFTVALFFLILIVFGIVIIQDAKSIKDDFPTKPSLYLFEYPEGKLSAGMYGVLSSDLGSMHFVKQEQLALYQLSFEKNDLKSIKGNNYRLFIVKENTFDSLETLNISETEVISREQFFTVIGSENSIDEYIKLRVGANPPENIKTALKNTLAQSNINTDAELRGMFLLVGLGSMIEKQGSLSLIQNMKDGKLIVYPKTIIFDILEVLPVSTIQSITGG